MASALKCLEAFARLRQTRTNLLSNSFFLPRPFNSGKLYLSRVLGEVSLLEKKESGPLYIYFLRLTKHGHEYLPCRLFCFALFYEEAVFQMAADRVKELFRFDQGDHSEASDAL